jgi:hypothetical protein
MRRVAWVRCGTRRDNRRCARLALSIYPRRFATDRSTGSLTPGASYHCWEAIMDSELLRIWKYPGGQVKNS